MNTIKRYSIFFYFLLTFIISWGGIVLVAGGPSKITLFTETFDQKLPLAILAILTGPSLVGILLTGIVDGKEGFRDFRRHLTKRVNLKWYGLTLLGAPIMVAAVYLFLSLFSSNYGFGFISSDNKISYIIAGLMTGLAAGFFEEIGWTGFAIPRLLKKNSVLKTGLIVGLIWAFWHILPGIWFGYASGTIKNTIFLISYLADPFFFLVIYRILMVWVYKQTESLPVAMVMHGSLTASARIFTPIGIVGIPLSIFGIVWALVMAVITRLIFIKNFKL